MFEEINKNLTHQNSILSIFKPVKVVTVTNTEPLSLEERPQEHHFDMGKNLY